MIDLNADSTGNLGNIQRSGGASLFIGGTLDNTSETLGANSTVLVGLTIDGELTIDGGVLDPVGLGLAFPAFVDLVLNGVTLVSGLTTGATNTLVLEGDDKVYSDASRTRPGTITAGGNATIDLTCTNTTVGYTIDLSYRGALTASTQDGSIATITIAPGAAVFAAGGYINQNLNGNTQPVVLTNDGLLEADASGFLIIQTGGLTNLLNGVLTGGTYETNPVGTMTIDAAAAITVDAADIILNGTGSEISVKALATLEPLEASLTTIAAGGILSIIGGELSIGQPSLFTASLSGLTSDDTVDFVGANITGAKFAGSTQASLHLTLDGGNTLTVPLLATAVTGNALPPRFDGSEGTQMTLLPIAADTGQYASTVPGVSGGVDAAPSFTIVYGATAITSDVPLTSLMSNEGVNWFLDFPSLPAATQSDPFFLAAQNRNTGGDTDSVTFTEIGGGSDVAVLGGSTTIDGILPGGDTVTRGHRRPGTGTGGAGRHARGLPDQHHRQWRHAAGGNPDDQRRHREPV